jgi:hypothetical protein
MRIDEVLEEKVEYSNATSFRKSFLKIVDRIEGTPGLRYVILKHGAPKAVVMSFEAYELIKRVLQNLFKQEDRRDRSKALEDAFNRMAEKHGLEKNQVAHAASIDESQLREIVRNLEEQAKLVRAVLEARSKPTDIEATAAAGWTSKAR